MNEHERIRALRALFARPATGEDAAARATLGIGDDAAVLEVGAARLVVSVDDQIEGTHFQTAWLSLEDLGARATMAAASDVAAMGGRLRFVLSSIAAPTSLDHEGLLAIARGQKRAADELGAAVIGGNLARSPVLAISTTVIGELDGAGLRRDGARPGDLVWLAGHVGRAAAGLSILSGLEEELTLEDSHAGRAARVCLDAWRRPLARQSSGLAAAREATAAIDVSDGLAADAEHLAEASGVRVVIEAPRLVLDATLLAVAKRLHRDALHLALTGGEDYALLVTASADVAAMPGFVCVGRCEGGAAGVSIAHADGTRTEPPYGWDHYR